MSLLRAGLILALVVGAGCTPGGPRRASDIQNLNGISDDIDAVRMTDSDTRHARDQNMRSTIPRNYEVNDY
jgi:hypothetical protein